MSFIEDNLLLANENISHHGEVPSFNEEMSPTLENLVVLTWLRLLHPDLPSLVKQRYGTELRSKSLASLKPEISQALDSLLEEISSNAVAKILCSNALKLRQPPARGLYNRFQKPGTKPQVKSCPLCKQAGRNDRQFLSQCTYLPAEDRAFLAKACLASSLDDEDDPTDSDFCPSEAEDFVSPPHSSTGVVSRCISKKQSPHFTAFYRHHSLKLTLDTGAKSSMIKASVTRSIDAPIVKTSQQALQADGVTSLVVVGETHVTLSRANKRLTLDALVVEDLSHDHVKRDDSLPQKFTAAQDALNSHKSIILPHASDQLWIVTDGSVAQCSLGATLYITRQDHLLAGFYSSKLCKHQVTWLPCEVEALSISAAVKHFSPFIIQSKHRTCVFTDSQSCVQALHKLC